MAIVLREEGYVLDDATNPDNTTPEGVKPPTVVSSVLAVSRNRYLWQSGIVPEGDNRVPQFGILYFLCSSNLRTPPQGNFSIYLLLRLPTRHGGHKPGASRCSSAPGIAPISTAEPVDAEPITNIRP